MKNIQFHTLATLLSLALVLLLSSVSFAEEKKFDSEEMITELKKKVELSKDKWEQLKPVLDEKSKDIAKGLHESIDQGYAELDKLTDQFESMSKDAEKKINTILSSEEAQKLKEFMAKVDEDAIGEARDKVVADLTELLQLTEEQAAKIKPILEESVVEFSTMMKETAKQSSKSWNELVQEFEQITKDLYDKVKDTLNDEQMERLENYDREQMEKIKKAYTV
jgi:hypothetical protein